MLDLADAPGFGRRAGIVFALELVHSRRRGPVTIVETGSTRGRLGGGRKGDGWATLAWGWYCARHGGTVHTVDIDPEALLQCREITSDYAESIQCHLCEGAEFLREFRGRIDLLYLDSADDPAVILDECLAAEPRLRAESVVMIDDANTRGGAAEGKGALAFPWLRAQGWEMVFENPNERQLVFSRLPMDRESSALSLSREDAG